MNYFVTFRKLMKFKKHDENFLHVCYIYLYALTRYFNLQIKKLKISILINLKLIIHNDLN